MKCNLCRYFKLTDDPKPGYGQCRKEHPDLVVVSNDKVQPDYRGKWPVVDGNNGDACGDFKAGTEPI